VPDDIMLLIFGYLAKGTLAYFGASQKQ